MKRLLVMTMLLFGLTACSTKMSYHFMDWAIEWGLDDYVSLNQQQETEFDNLLESFLSWHRQSELPKYSADLRQFRNQIDDGSLSPHSWQTFVEQLRGHWFHIFEQYFDEMWPLILSLTDEQVVNINQKLSEEQRALDQEYQDKTAEQLQQDADERLQDTLDDWLGSVTKEQKLLAQQYNREREFTTDMWLEYRHAWYQQFKQTLEQRDKTPQLKQQLHMLLTSPQQLRSDDYQQKLNQNTEKFGEFLVQLRSTLTAKQRYHLLKKLDDLIEDLDELAAESD
ncbi:hypothetical protein JYB87_10780 [Shewanella avicenniae]|uniref:Lipoprotein n=1 Tax=Shewanella avicenniae TaxID=2814294 RepID=A0ABX7QLK1_9GAMM|nr:DUF6279 family lipoprotein [Shewanella avicenniae]QSX32259.1 hypothetical protein JYB87_10780 [Shewanella avicenniae]